MNTFTKLTVSILLLGVTQQVFSQEIMYKTRQKVDLPFYDGNAVRSYFLKQQTAFDTLWLPVSVTVTYTDQDDNIFPMTNDIYEYDENGLLKKVSYYRSSDGYLMSAYFYNNTYIDPLMDILDTLFFNTYTDGDGINRPAIRYYYNNRQADSSYWEEYYQVWDGNKWKTEERSYVHLLDTATVSEFQDHIEVFDRDGNIKTSRKTVLAFDDKGNVVEAVSDCYSLYDGQYKLKHEYWYDSDGKCYNRNEFYTFSGPWQLVTKFTDIEWFEFHGFDNGDLLFHGRPQGLYNGYSPKNKNKMSSLNFWELYAGSMKLTIIDTIEWKTYPPSSHYFSYRTYNMCLASHRYYEYNEHYHLTCDISLNYEVWNCGPICDYVKHEYINNYDDRGRRYEYTWINTGFDKEYEEFNLQTKMTYTVDSFTYIVRPVGVDELPADRHGLLIVPNPSDGTVRITAEDDIATITLYASDGRLAYSRDGAGKEVTVDTQGLAAGIYIVRALLKDGGVRTGKVVVR